MNPSLFKDHTDGSCRLVRGGGHIAVLRIIVSALASAVLILAAGCVSKERYVYKRILSDYNRPISAGGAFAGKYPAPTAMPDPGIPLSLEDVVRMALENNPDVDVAVARIRQSEAIIDQAMAAFWPVLSAYTEYTAGDAPSAYLFKTIDQRGLPAGLNLNDPGSFSSLELGLRGRMNLFRGGRDYLRKRMAETGLEIGRLDRLSVQNGLVASVIHAYYNVLAAEDFVRIAHESVDTVDTQREIMHARFKAGGVLKSDVLSLQVRLAQAREDLIRAKNGLSLAFATLANLMGLDPDTEMLLGGADPVIVDLPPSYSQGLPMALAHRPELEKARLEVIKSRMGVDAARGEYLPRLDAVAHYYSADEGVSFDTSRANWTAGVILDWELFAGGGTGSAVREAEGILEEVLAADRKAALSVKLELKSAYLALEETAARVEVTRASVARAEESLRLVKKQYEGGSAEVTRYLDAELNRRWSEIRATAARYDLEKARADVGRALGLWADIQAWDYGSK